MPEEGLPTAITIVDGDAQVGVVGVRLTDTLIVRVTDAKTRPVQNQRVVFQAIAGGIGADLIPDTAITDADGRARSVWVLGTLAGAQRVEARVIATGPAGLLKSTFNATAQAAAADTILAVKGDDQTGTVGSLLFDSLAVLVTDHLGNPIAGTTVSWSIPGGQGTVSSTSTTTGADGRSAVTRRLGTSAGAQTTTATVAGVNGSPVTFNHTATAGGAVRLVKLHGDNPVQTAPAGFQLTDSLVVQAQDVNGNGVPGLSVLWVVTTPGGGSVSAQSSVTDAQGRAFTFWNLSPVAGANTLTAGATGLAQVQFSATGTSAQPAAIQAQSAVSQNGTAGQAAGAVPSVKVTDQNNNPVAGVTITFLVTQGGGSVSDGAASGAQVSVPTGANGVATLTAWNLGVVAGANALTATAAGSGITGNPVSFTATGNPGPAARVVITIQPPSTAQSGVALSAQPAARLEDANGNVVTQSGVQVTAQATGTGATLRGTTTVSTSAGVASFSGLDLFGLVGSYSLRFSAPGLTPDTSSVVSLSAGPAALLVLTTQPSTSAASAVPFAQQPVVQVQDAAGNPVAAAGLTITVAIASGGGSLGGSTTAQTDAAGVASFSGLSITGAAGTRTLVFTSGGLTSVTSNSITIGAGTPTALAITTAPSAIAQSGSVLAQQPVIELRDGSNNPVPLAGVSVTVSLTGAPAGVTLGGNPTVQTAASGSAAFAGLSLTGPAGNYTLDFAVTAGASGVSPVTSGVIALSAGGGSALTLEVPPPTTAQSGVALSPAPVLQLRDGSGNPVAQAGVAVSATITVGAGGSLTGTDTVLTSAAGVASFSNLRIAGPVGSYTLAFGGSGLAGVTASPITLNAGPAAVLAMTTQPASTAQSGVPLTTQPSVHLEDGAGNPVAQASVTVTASLASGGGTLGGTVAVQTDAQGLASFTDLAITGSVGSRTLAFAATGLTGVSSGSIALGAGLAANLAISAGNNQSATAGSPVAVDPRVLVTDASANPVAGVSVSFTVSSGGGTAAAVAVTDAAGLASVTWTLGPAAGANTMDATATLSGGPATVTFTATGQAGSAGQLAIATQPSGTAQSGVAFGQQPVIQLQDQNGNNVTTSGVAVTAVSSGTLGGNTVAFTVNGVATFTNLSLTGLAGSYQVTFTGNSLTGVSSAPINLTAGVASKLVIITQPAASTPSGVPFAQQPVVQVEDAAGNPVLSSGRQVTAAISSGPGGNLGAAGRSVLTDANGVATFLSLTLNGPVGTYTLLFSTAGLSSDVSASFDITAGAATQMSAASTTSQSATVGTSVAAAPTVLVQDAQNNPVAGVAVTFQVTAGSGSLNGAAAVSDAQGLASVTAWTLGTLAGTNTVTATATGLPTVTFNATGTAGSATDIALNAGNNQGATVNTAVTTAPSVKVMDANGNPVSGVSVSFVVVSGGGNVVGGAATTNSGGIAAVGSWTLGTVAGTNTLTATSGTLTGSPVSFTATGTGGSASTIAMNAGDNQTAPAGSAVAIPPSVLITDAFGNPKSGVGVTFAVASGGGSVTGASATSNASGIATVGSWTLGVVTGPNTLTATATGLSGSPVTFSATGATGAATTIALNAGNGQTAVAGSAVATAPSVKVTDAGGNPVSNVAVTFAVTGGGGTVQPVTSILTDAGGIAAVTSWTLGTTAGPNTLNATSAGLLGSPVTFTATGTAGAATQLAITTQPSTTAQNAAIFAVQPVVQLRDANGNNVSQANVGVTATVASGGGSLGGTATLNTNGSGQAGFAGLSITGTVGARTLSFTSLGLTSATSGTVTITAGPATTLAINAGNNQSAGVGTAVAVPPSVLITDVSGNPVSGTAVTFAVTGGGGTVVPVTAVTSNASGIASTTSWTLGPVAGANTLSATSGTLTGSPASFSATGTTGSATKLFVTTAAPTTAQNGIAFTTQPVVQLQDALGNPVAQAGVTVTAALFSVTRTLTNASAVTDGAGLATFSGLAINGTTGVDSLNFTSTGLASTLRTGLTVTAGTAVKLGMNRQPSTTGQSGVALATQPRAQVQDISGNSVSVNGVLVTATIFSGPAGSPTLTNATATTSAAGLATFAGLAINGPPGTYTLQFDATAAGYTAVVSGNIVLSVGPVSQLTITTQPLATVASGTPFSPPPVVQLRDAFGNAVPTAGTGVTAAIFSGTGGSLTNAVATTDAAGAATFTGLTLSGTAGDFTLSFTATGIPPVVSNTVTLTAGGGSKLGVTTQPSATAVNGAAFAIQPVIQLQDAIGNPVTTAGVAVTASIASGGGSIGGTVTVNTNTSGQAVFTNLSITGTVGSRTLLFAASGFAGVTSNAINLTAGPATTIVLNAGNGQTTTVNTAVAVAPAVLVTDQSGNPVSGVGVTFAVTSGGGAVNPISAVLTNASGIAAPSSWTLGTLAGTNTLSATAGGLTGSPVSFTATGVAGGATQLAMVTQPSGTAQSGAVFAQQPAVRLLDAFSNTVAQANVPIDVTIQTGGGTLSGTTPVNTASTGIATFSGLAITGSAGAHTLGFSGSGLTGVTSGAITLTAGSSTTGINSVLPSATVVGESYTVSVSVTGAGGTPTGTVVVSDGTVNCNVTLSAGAGSCALASTSVGSKTLTASYQGDANFLTSNTSTSHTVSQAATTTAITANTPNPAVVGAAYTVNFSVAVTAPGAGTPTGNVTVSDGTGGSCTVAVGTGTCQLTSTTAGSKTLVATYAGDANFSGSFSTGTSHTVNAASTTTTITAHTPDPVTLGNAISVTVSVTSAGGTPTGSVQVSDDVGASCSIASLTAGAGSCNLTPTAAGTRTLTAVFTSGSGNFTGSTSLGVSHAVSAAASTTTITNTSPDPSVAGQSVTVNVTVTGTGGTPTGTVTMTESASAATCTATLSGGSGACAMALAAAGSRTITATYNGDANFTTSSDTDPHTVNQAATSTSVGVITPSATVTGEAYTVNFTVAVTAPGGGTPTGNVTVSDGADSCTVAVAAGSCSLASTTAGTKSIVATYLGDANFLGSPSGGTSHVVSAASTVTTITADTPDPSSVGSSYSVSLTVAAVAPGAGTPAGTVTVDDGGLGNCVVTLSAGGGSCNLSTATTGAITLTATYGTTSDFGGSSDTESHTVNLIATTTTITNVNPASIVLGEQVTVSYSVTSGATGNVTVSDGTDGCSAAVAAGGCSFTPTTSGAKVITASYPGDATHAASSDTDALTVAAFGPPDAGQTTAQVPASGQVGVTTAITVQLRDSFGNLITSSGGNIIAASITSGPNTGASFTVTDIGDGSYTLEYVPLAGGGDDAIEITLSGTPIGGSPFLSSVP